MSKRHNKVNMWSMFDEVIETPRKKHQILIELLNQNSVAIYNTREQLRLHLRDKKKPSTAEMDSTLEAQAYMNEIERLMNNNHNAMWHSTVEENGKCAECKSDVAISEMGFLVCTNQKCGVMYTEVVDSSAEWRFYSADDSHHGNDPARCGMPINPLLSESSLGSSIASSSRMSYGMRRIKKFTEWQSMPYQEKARYDEFQTITIMANNAGLPKIIIDHAMYYHKKISEIQKFRGINRDGIIAASIYISCRKNDFPRTAKEIASMFMLDNSSATRACKNAMNIMNELEITTNSTHDYCETTPSIFIERYCSKLIMNHELTMVCKFVALKVDQISAIPENTPNALAAGIIFLISSLCHISFTKKQIHNVSGISEVTINKCYKKLLKYVDVIVPNIIVEKYASTDSDANTKGIDTESIYSPTGSTSGTLPE